MQDQTEPINLFWTGGWDSTFRLLQLIIVFRKRVQPYYIIDTTRKSVQNEKQAINKIRELLFKKYPFSESLLLPLKISSLTDIKLNEEITKAYKRIFKKDKIGIQYEWLSRFCNEHDLSSLEICYEKSIHPEDNIVFRVFGAIVKIEDECGYHYVIDEKNKKVDAQILFGKFKLISSDTTKQEMLEISKKEDFFEILEQTWFCHTPTRNNKPCGKCVPCIRVYREGLGWRLPFMAKLRYQVWPILYFISKKSNIN
jgi:hypothetical protein